MNAKAHIVWSLIGSLVALVYAVYMLIYLNNTAKCDKYLTKQDQTFRKVAVVVTWITIVLSGLSALGAFVALIAGDMTWHSMNPYASPMLE